MEAFGEKLRRQREQRGITLEAISSTTKISTRMLRALEEEHFEQLPGGVFNKGFIRAYARQVGLDEEEAINDYLAALHASQLRSENILPDLRAGKPARTAPQPVHYLSRESAPDEQAHDEHGHDRHDEDDHDDDAQHGAGKAVIASDESSMTEERRHLVRRGHDRRNEDRRNEDRRNEERRTGDEKHKEPWQIENRPAADLLRAARERKNDPARQSGMRIFATGTFGEVNFVKASNHVRWGTFAAALLFICAGLAFWTVRHHNRSLQPSAAPAAAVLSQTSSPPAALQPPLSSSSAANYSLKAKSESSAAKTSASTSRPAGTSISSANTPTPDVGVSVSHPTGASNPAALTLLIRADKTSWISITADGKLVAEETLIAPAEKSVRSSRQIVIKAGNAAGVSFLLNGKEIPAQGKDGEVRTYMFDASGMKVSANSQLPGTD